MNKLDLQVGDEVMLKKPHPCGESRFRITRTGADVRLLCLKCGRDLLLPRDRAEKAIRTLRPSTKSS